MAKKKPFYKRILLKISGEALAGRKKIGIDNDKLVEVAEEIAEIHKMGVQVALVVGAGNIFRGIVAGSLFKNNATGDQVNKIIFNGEVQFGDAHPEINKKRSLKVPASFYYDKSKDDDNTLWNYHELEAQDYEDKKFKQLRKGFFIQENNKIVIHQLSYGDRIKSARSKEYRSSKENYMYVYRYLKKGQRFIFEVRSNDDTLLDLIDTHLNNKTKYIGKAKGSEFGGKIKIEKLPNEKTENNETTKGNILYAESNLCFLNEYGEFTARPTAEQLTGNSNAQIDWQKSQVRYRKFMPYNRHRQNWDAERLIIEKGSVFVFKGNVDFSTELLEKGIGCFLTEGYGRVLVAPDFLTKKEYDQEKYQKPSNGKETPQMPENNINSTLISSLQTIVDREELNSKIFGWFKDNKDKFSKKITASQWSRVYNAAKTADTFRKLETNLVEIFKEKKHQVWSKKDRELINKVKKLSTDEANKIYAVKITAKKMREYVKHNK